MAKTTEDVVKNLKGKGVYQGPAKDSNPPMDTDFKTPQWLKDTGEAVVEGVSDAGKFVGNKLAEAFPAKSWTPQNTQQLVLGALPMLTGLAFGGTRGAAIGGQVGLKAIADIERGGSEASIEKQKRFWEQDFKERDLEMRAKKLDRDYMALMAQLGIRQEKFGLEKELAPSQRRLIEAKTAQALAGAEASKAKAGESDQKFYVPGIGQALTADDAKKLKEAKIQKGNFDRDLGEMIALRRKYPSGSVLDRNAVERGKQLSKKLLLTYKNLARLGVLSKSDEAIVNQIIPENPLALSIEPYVLGQDPILYRLEAFQKDLDEDYKTTITTRTRGGFVPSKPSGAVRPPSPRVKQLMDRDGISQQRAEAVLRAFDAQKKGGK